MSDLAPSPTRKHAMKKKTKADLEKEIRKLKKQTREQDKELKEYKELHELCLKRWCM